MALAGVNGSGKSTLLALLAGLFPPSEGSLHIVGMDMGKPCEAGKARQSTALLLQEADLQILGNTVGEDLLLSVEAASLQKNSLHPTCPGSAMQGDEAFNPPKEEDARARARDFALLDKWNAPPHTLSYGQRRKLCLAGAMLRKPRLLLLDEPFSGLDYPAVLELCALMLQYREAGMSIVVSSHDLTPFAPFTDSLLLLSPDRPPLFGPLRVLAEQCEDWGVRRPVFCE